MRNPFRGGRDRRSEDADGERGGGDGTPPVPPTGESGDASSSDREARRQAREARRREREAEEKRPAASAGKRREARDRRGDRARAWRSRLRKAGAPKARGAAWTRLEGARRASAEGLAATRRRAEGFTPHVHRAGAGIGAALRRLAALVFSGAALIEKSLRAVFALVVLVLGATTRRLERWVTPERGAFALVVAVAGCLAVSQFMDYRGVEVGQPGYADVAEIAEPPQRAQETPVDVHSFSLLALAAAAVGLAGIALLRRRPNLGRLVALAGAAAVVVILAVDMPRGLDEGEATLQYEGASATLNEAFYAELAAAAGLMLAGAALSLHLRREGRPARRGRREPRRRPRRRESPSLAGSGS